MKRFIAAACIVLATSTAEAAVSGHVYRADEQTPLSWADPNVPDVYRDIMVGTRLTIFIRSDGPGLWGGRLWHSWDNWAIGAVSGRDEDREIRGYEGSLLPAAGHEGAYVDDLMNPFGRGLNLTCGGYAVPGEWFVLDYHAKALGTCELGLYGAEASDSTPPDFYPGFGEPPPGQFIPIQAFSFNHVPSRDFSLDDVVDFVDFALLANDWRARAPDPNELEVTAAADPNIPASPDPNTPASPDPNTPSSPDLNTDEMIDIADLALFCAYWLERTDVNEPAADPNAPDGAEQ